MSAENPKRPPGRPSKLTPEIQQAICEKIAAVATFTEACTLAGVEVSTAQKWMTKGQQQRRGKYAQFFRAVGVAKTQCVVALKAGIRVHGRKDWKALQALGAMMEPVQFVPQLKVHVTSEIDGVLDALAETFKDKPELYEQALQAVVAHRAARSKLEEPAVEE